MEVYVRGKRVRLDPASSIGQGGEADVYDIGSGLALKLFKPPDHPDFAADPLAQQAAADRLQEHQQKLRDGVKRLTDALDQVKAKVATYREDAREIEVENVAIVN